EIDRLADRYRRAVVLCYVEGRSCEEAGRLLGCPAGTVKSRLARARELLRTRLVRLGVTLPAGALVAALAPEALQAAVPAALGEATVRAAARAAAGEALSTCGSAGAGVLAKGVLHTMKTRITLAVALAFFLGLMGAGAGMALSGAGPQRQPPAAPGDPVP